MTRAVVVDTNIWAAFLQRRSISEVVRELLRADRVRLISPVVSEVFAGLTFPNQLPAASRILGSAAWVPTTLRDWQTAAEIRLSLSAGPLTSRAGRRDLPSMPDCMLAVVAARIGGAVWTLDTEDAQRAINALGVNVPLFKPEAS